MERSHTERFYANTDDFINLIHELITNCNHLGATGINPTLVAIVSKFLKQYNHDDLIKNFIKQTSKYWLEIKNRKESFFEENGFQIFHDFPPNQVDAFKLLFQARNEQGKPYINDDDKDAVWNYLISLVKISIKYIHEGRGARMVMKDGKPSPAYTREFLHQINIQKYAKLYGIELAWPRK